VIVYLDGDWIDEDDAGISVRDRGFLFSDGVFETALLHRGRFFHLADHLQRLHSSAALMGINAPDAATLGGLATEIAARNELVDGSLRITLTAGSAAAPTLLITIAPRDTAWVERAAAGWNIITASTRRPSTAAVPAQLKALGRTYALLARREARVASADDALLLTDDGFICEGPSWNIFWRHGNEIFTPELGLGVLAGVTRTVLMQHASALGYVVNEGAYARPVLDTADEIFATMTSVGIARIRSLDGRVLQSATPAADALYEGYWRYVDESCRE
jgi:branched-chain amino acid aminotransferase